MTSLPFALQHSLPMVILGLGAMALLMIGAFRGPRSSGLVTELACGLLALCILVTAVEPHGRAIVFDAFVDDAFSRFAQVLALTGSLMTLIMSGEFMRAKRLDAFEFPVLILLSTLGMMVLISATSLIAVYLGLELMSLALYVLAAFYREDLRASEAGLKYFVLGALSSGMLLYGASLLYGFSGSVSFTGIAAAVQGHASIGVVFGLVFFISGLAFKMSTAPFHMWTPDVYEGAPTPVTAFFASAPKMAAVAVTVRVVIIAFPGILAEWQQIIAFIAIASMALGSFAAIAQANLKRMMAYSAIGQMGFALVGLASGTQQGVFGVAIYLSIYLTTVLAVFAVLLSLRVGGEYVEKISDLSGLARSNAPMAFVLAVAMFSLAGIPPLAGFFAKFYVFNAAVQAHLYPLAIIGVVTSVVALFYYLWIVKVMYFDEAAAPFDKQSPVLKTVMAVACALLVLFWVFPAPIVAAANAAAQSLF